MKVEYRVDASRALQSAKHRLFVEGSSDSEIDPIVLSELLRNNGLPQVDVTTMGGCDNVRSAAQALVNHHQSYYFVIDRDDQSDVDVEKSWSDFPNVSTHNLVIWRKRELENYFCDPDYLEKCDYLVCPPEKLRSLILKECRRRIYMDAANLAILATYRETRRPLAKHFANVDKFKNQSAGESELLNLQSIAVAKKSISKATSKPQLKKIYREFVADLSGGTLPLEFGKGTWLEKMSGKEVFRSIAGPCFKVVDLAGKVVVGKQQNIEVAKNLLRKNIADQPTDFQQLASLVGTRVTAS